MNKLLLGIAIIIVIGGAGIFLFLNQRNTVPSQSTIVSPTASQSISPTTTTQMDLEAGGNSYLDEKGVFSILYPNDWTLDTQDPVHIRIYKQSETQRPQSEMSDGALIVFETVSLEGASLSSFVDKRIKEATADGTSEVIEAKTAVTKNTYSGFQYMIRGLGTSHNLILQKDANSPYAVVITYAISDPQNRGYQKEVDAVLASLKLLK